jgi:hypothetical protein
LEILPDRRGVLIIDGTSFPKQGAHSVGVARQYCGALGKVANRQVAVTAALWTGTRAWWPGVLLYLPQSWSEECERTVRGPHSIDGCRFRRNGVKPSRVSTKSTCMMLLASAAARTSVSVTPGGFSVRRRRSAAVQALGQTKFSLHSLFGTQEVFATHMLVAFWSERFCIVFGKATFRRVGNASETDSPARCMTGNCTHRNEEKAGGWLVGTTSVGASDCFRQPAVCCL